MKNRRRKKRLKETIDRKFLHAIKRARQRYGIIIDEKTYNMILKKIKNVSSDSICLCKYSNTRTIWAVLHDGCMFVPLYDKTKHMIPTFFPLDSLASYSRDMEEDRIKLLRDIVSMADNSESLLLSI